MTLRGMTLHVVKSAVLLAIAANLLPAQQFTISTFAGGVPPVTPAPALEASIGIPQALAADANGNIYFNGLNCVFKLDSAGILTVVAGNGRQGFSGDGGPASQAQLSLPEPYAGDELDFSFSAGLAVTPSGDLLIADSGNNRIRKVSQGLITTIAGGGNCRVSCDGQAATNLSLADPASLVADSAGNLYFVDRSDEVYKVTPAGLASVVYSSTDIGNISALALDSTGNLYIAKPFTPQILRLAADGTVTPFAGTGTAGYSGDGGPAIAAQLTCPVSLIADYYGNLYIGDVLPDQSDGGRIRRVTNDGNIATFAGTGQPGYPGYAGSGNQGGVSPWGFVFDGAGDLLIADAFSLQIRKLSDNFLTTVAGSGFDSFAGDGGPATQALFHFPSALAHDRLGNVYIADAGNNRVRRISPDGVVVTIAGCGSPGYSGDGGQATSAQITANYLAVDSAGNLYIAGGAVVRKVTPEGTISTLAGTGVFGYSGDGGPASAAQLGGFPALAVDGSGNVYIADQPRLRKVSPDGIITTIAGNGTYAGIADGSAAANSSFVAQAIAVSSAGDIFAGIARAVYKISAAGIVSAITSPTNGTLPTGPIPAASAALGSVASLALDAAGTLYVADSSNGIVFRISTDEIIEPIAGSGYYSTWQDGTPNYSGDGGPALDAVFDPWGIDVDTSGKIYIADAFNNAIRLLEASGAKRAPGTRR
jgi:trimeric autotransporter adhesin